MVEWQAERGCLGQTVMDGGLSGAIGLVLSIRCISLVPLPFKDHQRALHNSTEGRKAGRTAVVSPDKGPCP